jgi:hypothetical protein
MGVAMILPVLSIRQPWAWCVIHGGKDIENRDWTTTFRGRFVVHASKGGTKQDMREAYAFIHVASKGHVWIPENLDRGGIIGSVELVDVVEQSESPWFVGRYGLVLSDPRPLPFTPCKGQLGLFECPDDARRSLIEWKKRQVV